MVLTPGEVNLLLQCTSHQPYQLILRLLYGSGLRLIECLRLRVQDLDFVRQVITVRSGKGAKDRFTMLPAKVEKDLKEHLCKVQSQFKRDLADGFADVYLPNAIARKYPKAGQQWNWQYIFPAEQPSKDPRSGVIRCHHVYMGTVNRAIRKAADLAGIRKKITAHSFRHSFATHLLESGSPIHVVQELLGHENIETTKIYLHCLNTPGESVTSPLDQL